MDVIRFYKVDDPYGFLSNFAPYPIFIENELWKTVEHYFQASKFNDRSIKLKIMGMDSPMKAANEGRNRDNLLKKDWENIKEDVMRRALRSKFLQHPKLRKELILTGSNVLIEHTVNDSYWADGGDGTGKNRLGRLLMEVRDEIQKHSNNPDLVLPPWVAFPFISQNDLFWRMGLGEDYLTQWAKFYLKSDKAWYKVIFPETEDWKGIYD
jgi:N-glycosidase YbiA